MSAPKSIRHLQSRIDRRGNFIAELELRASYFSIRAMTSKHAKYTLWALRDEIKELAKEQREDRQAMKVLHASVNVTRQHAKLLGKLIQSIGWAATAELLR
jgi:predicted RNase H-like nuclease (RuvC/YqgF family)